MKLSLSFGDTSHGTFVVKRLVRQVVPKALFQAGVLRQHRLILLPPTSMTPHQSTAHVARTIVQFPSYISKTLWPGTSKEDCLCSRYYRSRKMWINLSRWGETISLSDGFRFPEGNTHSSNRRSPDNSITVRWYSHSRMACCNCFRADNF